MYLLGSKGEDVLSSFDLTNEEVENYNVVVARFNTYFNVRTNMIYESAVFNRINVLQRLATAGIKLNGDKCEFSQECMKFLCHIVDGDGIRADPEKITAVREMPEPSHINQAGTRVFRHGNLTLTLIQNRHQKVFYRGGFTFVQDGLTF